MAGGRASPLPPRVLAWLGGATGVCPARHSPCEMPIGFSRGFKIGRCDEAGRQVRVGSIVARPLQA